MDLKKFKELPVMGIIRGIKPRDLEPLVETIIPAGLKTIEITMDTQGACGLTKKAVNISKNKLIVGAGTVLNVNDLKLALDSGATFIVTPVLIEEVVEYCLKNKIPVFPGALTPQEIYKAWEHGATMVKVFPAKFFGPEYFQEIKGPFKKIELLACGGVTAKNVKDYFTCGSSAVAFGASIFRQSWLKEKDFVSIGRAIKEFVEAIKSCPKGG